MADHHSSHSDYVHGEMDINQHRHSFELFVTLTKWCSYHLAVVLTFVILLTCTKAGFLTALIVAIVIAVVGWLLLKKKPDAH
jgi:hypothetical protein